MPSTPRVPEDRARTLLKNIDEELSSIPDYKGTITGKPMEAPFQMLSHGITAARRAVRHLKGEPTVDSLLKRRRSLERYIEDAEKLKSMDFGGVSSGEMGRSMTTASKSDYMNKQRRERAQKYKSGGEVRLSNAKSSQRSSTMAKKNGKLGGAGTTDPTVVPPEGGRPPITKNQILEEERERLAKEKRNRLRPKKRPGSGTVDKEGGSASPRQFQPPNENQNKRGFTPGEQTPPNKPKRPHKRPHNAEQGARPKRSHKRPHNAEQMARPERERDRWSITDDIPTYVPQGNTKPMEEPGGTLDDMGPKIVGRGRPRKPMQLAPIGMKHGGMAKKGGKSKVRGAGIARKGVRPAKMR